jgi:Ser/Thr protein kinase RdoA (MazF antagonist)
MDEILGQWHGDGGSIRRVSESTNDVYSFTAEGVRRYLRLRSIRDRSKAQIEAELDFITHLQGGGISVAQPIPSDRGQLIEVLTTANDELFACVFAEAEGEQFKYDLARDNKEHFRLLGRTLGHIHALSQTYVPSCAGRRFAWDEDNLLVKVAEFLPKSEVATWREYHAMKEQLRDRPVSDQSYGLVHGDFGGTNYRCTGTQLTVFDFDDCCYHWFAYDLAIIIYPHGWRREGLQLLDWLLEGYTEHVMSNLQLSDITMFGQWRLLYMFLVYARKWGFEKLSMQQSEWFERKRENILRGYTWCMKRP